MAVPGEQLGSKLLLILAATLGQGEAAMVNGQLIKTKPRLSAKIALKLLMSLLANYH